MPKKTAVNNTEHNKAYSLSINGKIANSRDTVPVRGKANSGPISKYTRIAKNFANRRSTMLPRSFIESPVKTTAVIPKIAIPASVTMKPNSAQKKFVPACWPMAGGKIIVPAPKNIANNVIEIDNICKKFSFFRNIVSFYI